MYMGGKQRQKQNNVDDQNHSGRRKKTCNPWQKNKAKNGAYELELLWEERRKTEQNHLRHQYIKNHKAIDREKENRKDS